MVEFALVLSVLMLIVLGIFKFGIVFNNYLTLTDAVRAGARQLALERGQADPCTDTRNRIISSAGSLDPLKLNIIDPPAASPTCSLVLVSGNPVTVTAKYPCDLKFLGIDFAPSCKLSASATERTE